MTNYAKKTKELEQIKAIATALYQLKEIPSGHLYARILEEAYIRKYPQVTITNKGK